MLRVRARPRVRAVNDVESTMLTAQLVLDRGGIVGRLTNDERAAIVALGVAAGRQRAELARLTQFRSITALSAWCAKHDVVLPLDPEPADVWMRRYVERARTGRAGRVRFKNDPGVRAR